MRQAVVALEFKGSAEDDGSMRWERSERGPEKVFELLGRAFEVAQRETGESLAPSLAAVFRGAMLSKADVAAVLETMK